MFRIVQPDATHSLVYNDATTWNPVTLRYVPTLVFSGTRTECEAFVNARLSERRRIAHCG
jgi:hypothetical protein